MRRRDFLKMMLASTAAGCISGCSRVAYGNRRVIVLAFDGMDPLIVRGLMQIGRMPNFSRLAASGSFSSIATSDPPQTPVAFSNIISGADANLHQIFDFIHREANPKNQGVPRPYFSTSDIRLPETERALSVGGWRLPLNSGTPELLRIGTAFWNPIVHRNQRASVFYVPSNYPPKAVEGHGDQFTSISGMGTPDLTGGYGEFTIFSPDVPKEGRIVRGGSFVRLLLVNHRGNGEISGPADPMRAPSADNHPPLKVAFQIVRDSQAKVVKIEIQSHIVLLNEGEWSQWLPIHFESGVPGSAILGALQAPTAISGMVRFYIKQVHPKLELYASPVNIDPQRPVTPISSPPDAAAKLAEQHGRYYTIGIPEDTNALQSGALTEDQFLSQTECVREERVEQLHRSLAEFDRGCFFFYFGETDLISHMFWRDRDSGHPGRVASQGDRYANVIDNLYIKMDEIVGQTMDVLRDDDTLIVLSDHGFTSFRRAVNLNTALRDLGFLTLKKSEESGAELDFLNVDWDRTRAYAMGLNSIFINVRGREKNGTVAPGVEQQAMAEKVAASLLELRDADGAQPIWSVTIGAERFPQGNPLIAPDLIVGYADNYRVGWNTALGGIPNAVFEDNMNRWSGDHCVAAELVPGILLMNQKRHVDGPIRLVDVAPTILTLLDVPVPEEMHGRPMLVRV